ncbi:hypothetical protein PFISCL1PPCAC_1539, partial [Pristionchus fissidentatus]
NNNKRTFSDTVTHGQTIDRAMRTSYLNQKNGRLALGALGALSNWANRKLNLYSVLLRRLDDAKVRRSP